MRNTAPARCALVLVALLLPNPLAAQTVTLEQWRSDIQTLGRELPLRHVTLTHTISRARFDSAIADLQRRLPTLKRHQIIVRIQQVLALVGDGHTTLPFVPASEDPVTRPFTDLGFHRLPLRLFAFDDGLFVVAAAPPVADLVGARVLRIGDVPVERALALAESLASGDNSMQRREIAPYYLNLAEVLHALGLSKSTSGARFMVQDTSGRTRAVDVAPMADSAPDAWAEARLGPPAETPLWIRYQRKSYWLTYQPDTRLLYVQINRFRNDNGESFADFAARIERSLKEAPVDRLVLDLRYAAGGDATLTRPLLHVLIRSAPLLPRGKLFVVTGRRAFSASMNFIGDLSRHTDAIYVGEPTGGRPNHYGETTRMVLPNSGLVLSYSSLFWQTGGPRDRREWVAPEVHVPVRFEDYRVNRDPVLEAIFAYQRKPLLRIVLESAYDSGGVTNLLAEYGRVKETYRTPYATPADTVLRRVGMTIWNRGQEQDAIEVWQVWAREFPESGAAFNLLAQAYEEAGDTALALQYYQRAAESKPRVWDVYDQVRRLKREAGSR